jgi:LacI family transcriptional regulator
MERHRADLPDGIIAGADLLAASLVQTVISSSDLRFPQDMAIVGYDDNQSAWDSLVPLTTLAQPGLEMGKLAALRLIDEITDPAEHVHQRAILTPSLVIRESTLRTGGATNPE